MIDTRETGLAERPDPEADQPRRRRPSAGSDVDGPCFVLAPPLCFSSQIGAMLGQHPQLCGLPEIHLLPCATMEEWRTSCGDPSYDMSHGLLRAVAQLAYGAQTETAVAQASGWLRRRRYMTTGRLMESLAWLVYPRILVDKSPSIAASVNAMWRTYAMFPQASFVHVLRHPRAFCDSVLAAIQEAAGHDLAPGWLIRLATFPPVLTPDDDADPPLPPGTHDPQWSWYGLNRNIMDFLAGIPREQVYRIRSEDVLTDPDTALRPLCAWLGLRDDAEAIDEMKHPERSPFACFGPMNAPYGDDPSFLRNPALQLGCPQTQGLEEPLEWLPYGLGFAPAVRRLAREFGYT